ELLDVSLPQLKSKLGDDTGSWVYEIIRGEDASEVNSRTQIKSMLSAKSFRPTINSYDQAVKWLRIFVADIFSRLMEEGVLGNKRRPKTINLHHRQGGQMRSRQSPIPSGRPLDENVLFEIAKNLLGQVVVDGRAWPCANLQLSVGGFENGPTGNRGIGGFLVRGDRAKAMKHLQDGDDHASNHGDPPPEKRLKSEHGAIQRFLSRQGTSHGESDEDLASIDSDLECVRASSVPPNVASDAQPCSGCENLSTNERSSSPFPAESEPKPASSTSTSSTDSYTCRECHKTLPSVRKEEHEDWHFAKSIAAADQGGLHQARMASESRPKTPIALKKSGASKASVGHNQKRVEKGQKRLAFG
ncbi:MAG: hypothetical protein Q9166_007240, partial [cf. Caloplaca sp. 2 TL-2023]